MLHRRGYPARPWLSPCINVQCSQTFAPEQLSREVYRPVGWSVGRAVLPADRSLLARRPSMRR